MIYHFLSRTGQRDRNEDAYGFCIKQNGALFLVADGLGGHANGATASRICVDSGRLAFSMQSKEAAPNGLGRQIAAVFEAAQADLRSFQRDNPQLHGLKSTLAALVVTHNAAAWGHVGDSRLYHIRRNRLLTRTRDHSVPEALVKAGQLRERELYRHPDRNRLLRVMGTPWEQPQYEISSETGIKSGDRFLLCSDGFWEHLPERLLLQICKQSENPAQWLRAMEGAMILHSGHQRLDNYTAIAVQI